MAKVKGTIDGTSGINPQVQAAVWGESESDVGVIGLSGEAVGVQGMSLFDRGIFGMGRTVGVHGSGFQRGMLAECGQTLANGAVAAIEATANAASGVYANSVRGAGVYAYSEEATAVYATSTDGDGVRGIAQGKGTGVLGLSVSGLAGDFRGPVSVSGSFTVFGAKSAAVRHRDGKHRLMYSLECPDSWFEDFGDCRLLLGRATVGIDVMFARSVVLKRYHVFLTPQGECANLYIAKQTSRSFEVREAGGGRSNVRFSFRIVAKRRDVNVRRFATVSKPVAPTHIAAPTHGSKGARSKATRM